MSKGLKSFLAYSAAVLLLSVAYYGYVSSSHPTSPERETFLSELGEGVGEVALWVFAFIYVRTAVKLVMGKGPLARRLLPDYSAPASASYLGHLVVYLDRSHIYFGVAAVALVLVHIALMGLRTDILFFQSFWHLFYGRDCLACSCSGAVRLGICESCRTSFTRNSSRALQLAPLPTLGIF